MAFLWSKYRFACYRYRAVFVSLFLSLEEVYLIYGAFFQVCSTISLYKLIKIPQVPDVAGFETAAAAATAIKAGEIEPSIDGVTLVQSYIKSPRGIVTRAEFIGGKFNYAVEIDATKGLELCPADVCQMPGAEATPQFTIVDSIDTELASRYEAFLRANGIDIAGIEFVTDASGKCFTYDVNTNTNYNPEAEKIAARNAPAAVAQFLITERDHQLHTTPTEAFAFATACD